MATYLITGGAGFIGSHLSEMLLEKGHNVLVIDDLSSGFFENIQHLISNPRFHFARASVNDKIVLDRLVSQTDIVVHLAAAVGVKMIIERPVYTIENNILGTETVLKSCLHYGCRFLLASTSEIFGKGKNIPLKEDDDVVLGATTKSRWSYATSKMIDEFLALAYQKKYGLKVVILRIFNTIGPRQIGHYGMVVPNFMSQALQGKPITVYGDGTQSRCFCDVRDLVKAIYLLSQHPDVLGQVFNIGTQNEITIMELAEQIKAISESKSEIVLIPYSEAYIHGFEDMKRRVPDTTRIYSLLGWQPTITLTETLVQVRDWIKSKNEC